MGRLAGCSFTLPSKQPSRTSPKGGSPSARDIPEPVMFGCGPYRQSRRASRRAARCIVRRLRISGRDIGSGYRFPDPASRKLRAPMLATKINEMGCARLTTVNGEPLFQDLQRLCLVARKPEGKIGRQKRPINRAAGEFGLVSAKRRSQRSCSESPARSHSSGRQ